MRGLLSTLTCCRRRVFITPPATRPVERRPPTVVRPPSSRGRLCLNMIVRNEEKVLPRFLAAVEGVVDCVCICDTGSTDDTVAVVEAWLTARGLPGEVYAEPWRNFGYNRTHALRRAQAWGEYALLLDADMVLVNGLALTTTNLAAPGYLLAQRCGALEYYNLRLVRTDLNVTCVGPTHEYYDFPPDTGAPERLDACWIADHGDGGCKADKFTRDIQLLTAAVAEEPSNSRHAFYLAESYKNGGHPEKALVEYARRVALGGWVEECMYAALQAGHVARDLGREDEAISWWLRAYQIRPCRAEAVYELCRHYRVKGMHHVGMIFCALGLGIPYPTNDSLFVHRDVYEYQFEYEHLVLAFYCGAPGRVDKFPEVLARMPWCRENLLANYAFYTPRLAVCGVQTEFGATFQRDVGGRVETFRGSSPCLVPYRQGYLLNVRYVNYLIGSTGGYTTDHPDTKIVTLNQVMWLTRDLVPTAKALDDSLPHTTTTIQGYEDLRLLPRADGSLWCHAVAEVPNPEQRTIAIHMGPYTPGLPRPLRHFASPTGRRCEKNWALFEDDAGTLRCVYEWSPLWLGTVTPTAVELEAPRPAPKDWAELRGGSNGTRVGDEIWFLTHLVHHTTPRVYYHRFVTLDATTLEPGRASVLFKFGASSIEYGLGLVVETDRVLITYSQNDATSTLLVLPRAEVEALFLPVPGTAEK